MLLFLTFDTHIHTHSIYFGVGVLSSFLKSCGHTVEWVHIDRRWNAEKAAAEVARFNPAVVGLSLMTSDWIRAREMLPTIRKAAPDAVFVAGGVHPSARPQEVIDHPSIDAVCVGEGEHALLELVQSVEEGKPYDAIQNLVVKRGETVRRNPLRPPIEDLDTLPWPDHALFKAWQQGVVQVLTGRGCPFKCTFCAVPAMHNLYKGIGQFLRRRSVANVIEELKYIQTILPIHHIQFIDDTFTIPRAWSMEFAEAYRAEIPIPFTIITRCDTVDGELLTALFRAGLRCVSFGVESGSPRIRRLVKRPMSDETILNAFQLCRERGIMTTANYIVGFPGETREDILMTMELHKKIVPGNITVWYFYPYPDTDLEAICREQNLLPVDFDKLPVTHFKPLLHLPNLTRDDLIRLHNTFVHDWTDEMLGRIRDLREALSMPASGEELEQMRRSVLGFYHMPSRAEDPALVGLA